MKKALVISFLTICMYALGFAQDQLPEQAQTFLNQYFETNTVQKISRYDVNSTHVFTAILKDKTQIEFDQTGAWSKVNYAKAPKTIAFLPEEMQTELVTTKQLKKVKSVVTDGFDIQIRLKNKKEVNGNRFGAILK